MPQPLPLQDFLHADGIILDVRSPGEFEQAHIPGAMNLPLFSNEERARVGTCYKRQGRDAAVELGFEIAGPKFVSFVRRAKQLVGDRPIRLHCWRGGLRSETMAWVLRTAGLSVEVLEGGYKAFRRWCLSTFAETRPIAILGGMTGTGKTYTLHALAARGEQILDLEGLANHRGSSYGALGLPPQPSTEQYENAIAMQWAALDPHKLVWIEAESRTVGCCRVPQAVFAQMERAVVFRIQRTRQERIDSIVDVYGSEDRRGLIEATQRIRKRLGGERTQAAIALLEQGKLAEAFDIVLHYYDKTYTYDLERRSSDSYTIDVSGLLYEEAAGILIEKARFFLSESGLG
ncbi:tRNA 2-selenouridine(34) synthase MnmH [Synechococcus sp. PCC 7336]|uniref:tRNA 2-selenouridine(34) synthase MnmH n=1 Tax=Synechococcus sp. PCC 7336 TaxID=195250 RepID=UPI000344C887|nr:tRNA 2-selenouridine(34) synthase MnmH [Synechococcus sp. PCC 7336]